MDAKTGYSSNVSAVKKIAALDEGIAKKLQAGSIRAEKYKTNWQSVDINKVVAKFTPNAAPYRKDGKIIFENHEHTIAVVADIAGGYLRIQDLKSTAKNGTYLTLDGKDGHNVTENGKTRGRSKAEYELATHFRIKKLEELK